MNNGKSKMENALILFFAQSANNYPEADSCPPPFVLLVEA
jgi:hypothetical protein